MDNITNLFDRFRQTTEDLPAAILTLASVLSGEQANDAPLTVKQAAEQLNVSIDTIYQMCEAGKIKCQRLGNGRGTIRIRPADLRRLA